MKQPTITAKQLWTSLPKVIQRVRKGVRFTVLYRNRPVFQIVPLELPAASSGRLEAESLYPAKPVGRSNSAAGHDAVLY